MKIPSPTFRPRRQRWLAAAMLAVAALGLPVMAPSAASAAPVADEVTISATSALTMRIFNHTNEVFVLDYANKVNNAGTWGPRPLARLQPGASTEFRIDGAFTLGLQVQYRRLSGEAIYFEAFNPATNTNTATARSDDPTSTVWSEIDSGWKPTAVFHIIPAISGPAIPGAHAAASAG